VASGRRPSGGGSGLSYRIKMMLSSTPTAKWVKKQQSKSMHNSTFPHDLMSISSKYKYYGRL